MIFWQKHDKKHRLKYKVKKISYLGIYDQHGQKRYDNDNMWFRMWVQTEKGHFDVLYNGNIYKPKNDTNILIDKDCGLTMTHKRCFDLIIAKLCRS